MNDDFELDPRVLDWLGDGPTAAPRAVVESSFAAAARIGQAARWTQLPWRDPLARPILGHRSSPMIIAVVLVLVMTVAVTALLTGGGFAPPAAPIRNGPLAFADGFGSGTLLIIDRPGATPRPLTIPGLGAKESQLPAFSPDGTRLAFYFLDPVSLAAGVGVANLDGSNLVTFPATFVQPGPGGVPRETGMWTPIAWSPDGRRILYVDQYIGTGTVMIGDLATGSATPISIPGGLKADSPAWSPDGQRVLLRTVGASADGRKTGLAVADLDTGRVQSITPADGLFDQEDYAGPQWSPDGSTIAFHAAPTVGAGHDIFTVRPDGSGKTRITSSANDDLWPTWAPDGQHLAWITGSSNGRDVIVANPDGTGWRDVSGPAAGEIFIMPFYGWSPDGAKVYVIACDGSFCDRFVELDALGSSQPVVVDGVPGPAGVSWGRQP